ncbi:hypothetical protein FRD01_20215 [Microvenator marinus]|jgi:hypothetical protein|uniref:Uncharacterized protein n=1 Tax=Microvenator marinus TaxID=2600177 RepID=A0A5B8XX10_9DELT|nr:hypothetical protein [Microvenator marinus]QED29518.1 hypothetical protein FRD01_20215 [Microvenator marinus]
MDLRVHLQDKGISFIDAADVQPASDESLVLDALRGSRLAVLLKDVERGTWPVVSPGRYTLQLQIQLKREGVSALATIDRILYEIYAIETAKVWRLERKKWP